MIKIHSTQIAPKIENGLLHSLGSVSINNTEMRNSSIRFLPWFDTYEGDVFDRFRFIRIATTKKGATLELEAMSSNDYPFREKRDSSGDICFRAVNWDAPGLKASVKVHFEPASDEVDGHRFEGFKYWFEIKSPSVKIHRLLDRQTWEIGGHLDKITLILRNWLTPPRVSLDKSSEYSTAGHEKIIGCMPGNLWGRWTLLPSFDLQRGKDGLLLAYFDKVSLIRTVFETAPGEDCLRCLDMHYGENTHTFATNPKTILHCPDTLDDVDLMNLWTRMQDRERDKAQAQFGIKKEGPPEINLCKNDWINVNFEKNYQDGIELASELNADNFFIDPIWQSCETLYNAIHKEVPKGKLKGSVLTKVKRANHCGLLDWEIDEMRGGEKGLKNLVQFARKKGINIFSWMGAFASPVSYWCEDHVNHKLGTTKFGVFAQKESGCHPDSGYPGDCWPLNLDGPIRDHVVKRVKDVCKRIGIKGFLWDSFSNMGWWQLNYADGSMKPQFDKLAGMYAELTNEGIYLMTEAITTFSSHSCLGMHGQNPYAGDDLGYSYDSNIHMPSVPGGNLYDAFEDCQILMGKLPVEILFEYFAHRRVPNFSMPSVPKNKRDPRALSKLRELFTLYKIVRPHMHTRTVLKNGLGVLWLSKDGKKKTLFTFKKQKTASQCFDIASHQTYESGDTINSHRVYSYSL